MFQGGVMSPAMAMAAGLIQGGARSADPGAMGKGIASGLMNAQQAQALLNQEKLASRRAALQEAQHGLNEERLQAALARDQLQRDRFEAENQRYTDQQQDRADKRQMMAGMRSELFGDGSPPVDGVGPSRPGALAEMQEANPLKAAAARMAFESGDADLLGRMITPEQAEDPKFYGGILKFHDGQGNIKLMQPSSTGEMREIQGPEGFQPLQNAQWVNAGGQQVPTFGGRQIDGGAIDVTLKQSETAEHAADLVAAKDTAKSQTAAKMDLPAVESDITGIKQKLRDMLDDPAMPYSVGYMRNISGAAAGVKGSPIARFDGRLRQFEGEAFLQGANVLTGVMTDSDRQGVVDKFSRIKPDLEPADFRQAVRDAEAELDRLVQRKYKQAGQEMPKPDAAPLSDEDLLSKYGIN
jgi:hypothetical protein